MAAVDLAHLLEDRRIAVDRALDRFLPAAEQPPAEIHAAMRFAALSPGKRLRPIVSLCIGELCDAPAEATLQAACALECVHTASLILDDLPCMDDATERRGREPLHKAYSVETALLASYGLLAEAFARASALPQGGALCGVLATAIGTRGLVFGQHLDLTAGGAPMTIRQLQEMHEHKAGALFVAAVQLPLLLAQAPPETVQALTAFASKLGLAFQISDDVLDAREPIEDENKSTFVTVQSEDEALRQIETLTQEAHEVLLPFGPKAEPLRQMTAYVASRAR